MKNILFTLALLISFNSFGQDDSEIDIIFEKKCAELNSTLTPVMFVDGIRLDYISCTEDRAVIYEFSFNNIDIKDDSQKKQEFDVNNDGNIDFWYNTPDDIVLVKKGFEITITAPSLGGEWFEEFKVKKSQIAFSAYDKNEKFLFVIIYDVLGGKYERNIFAEKQIENMYTSAENIFDEIE